MVGGVTVKHGKKSNILVALFLAVIVTAIYGVSHTEAAKGILDGKTFVGPKGHKGEKANGVEEVTFRDGKFYSIPCAQWGFGGGDYSVRVDGETIYFEATTLSAKHGKMVWRGAVRGDKVEGTYIWTKKRWYWKDAYQENWFKGVLQE